MYIQRRKTPKSVINDRHLYSPPFSLCGLFHRQKMMRCIASFRASQVCRHFYEQPPAASARPILVWKGSSFHSFSLREPKKAPPSPTVARARLNEAINISVFDESIEEHEMLAISLVTRSVTAYGMAHVATLSSPAKGKTAITEKEERLNAERKTQRERERKRSSHLTLLVHRTLTLTPLFPESLV
jgi:hypothetical protein